MEFQRYFTLNEAASTLPLVKRIVADILETGRSLRDYLKKITPQRTQPTSAATPKSTPVQSAASNISFDDDSTILEHRAALMEYLGELETMGCFYKDWNFQVGLIDFPAIINDEQVFLCWRSDEPALAFYHRIADGYAGRRPLPPDWTGDS